MRRVLTTSFFDRPADIVARELLGKYLCRRIDGSTHALKIIETEAYIGPHDLASHAARGRTARNAPMFGPAGTWYVYFVYGMHWMLNVVTGPTNFPAAVLIRGVEGISGPARLTKHLQIARAQNAAHTTRASGLWIEDRDDDITPRAITRTPRIGVGYAGPVWSEKKLRFVLRA